MAATPLFGGTNSVTLLDVGQIGSVKRIAGEARYPANVTRGRPEVPQAVSKPVQTDFVIVDRLGFQGQNVIWKGNATFKRMADYLVIEDNITRALHGWVRDHGTGIPGAITKAELNPTRLVDSHGNTMADRATLIDANIGEVKALQGDHAFWASITLTFKLLR